MTASASTRENRRAWWTGIVAGMASYIDAAALVATGIALVIYQQSIGLTPGEVGILSGMVAFAVAAGALLGGRAGDRFGRRRVFLITLAAIVAGAAFLTFGQSFALLAVGIALVGLGVGADLPVSLATIAEAANDRNRGALIVLSNTLWGIGILATIAISSVVGGWGYLGGQILFGHIGVVALIVLVLRLSIPESPTWLAASAATADGSPTVATKARLRDLVRAPYLVPFVVLMVFYTLTNLAANTSGQFNTYVAVNVADVPVETISQVTLIVFPFATIAGIWFMKVVDTRFRMLFVGIGGILMVAGYLVPVFFGFSLVTLVVLLGMTMVGSAFSFEGIMKVWTQESFPTMLRATAQGTILAVARVFAGVLATVTPALLAFNATALYLGLSLVTAAGLLTAWFAFRGRSRNEFHEDEDEHEALTVSSPSASEPSAV